MSSVNFDVDIPNTQIFIFSEGTGLAIKAPGRIYKDHDLEIPYHHGQANVVADTTTGLLEQLMVKEY